MSIQMALGKRKAKIFYKSVIDPIPSTGPGSSGPSKVHCRTPLPPSLEDPVLVLNTQILPA